MIEPDYIRTMARYNLWQNRNAFAAADTLDDAARDLDRGAFFGSIRHTLNHLYWGDRIWMSRFTPVVSPPQVEPTRSFEAFADWAGLRAARPVLDDEIVEWALSLEPSDLEGDLSWTSAMMKGGATRPRALCIVGFFNHQIHHRGQVHAMLTAAGCETEVTDLIAMPESV